jgi:hypothetical protein
MSRIPVSHSAMPILSAGTSRVAEHASKGAWAHDRIRIERLAYDLYERRGRQEGQDLEDWLKAEQRLVGASGKALW